MIETRQLTKRYGSTLALDRVSVVIQPGEVVGLLGPNGAGKSTMLKILTGYLPPTEGSATLASFNVADDSLSVRQRVGYLPETNPLYEDLAVSESLEWTARLRGMDMATWRPAIQKAVSSCGLESVLGKEIGQLSKGFRQRVGLAQAILHDPEILILDEPTSGLDPNQQEEVRRLIQTLRQKKTVLLSTHILSEARSSCDRVLIINKGQIVADGSPRDLGQSLTPGQRLVLELKAPGEQARTLIAALSGVSRVMIQRVDGERVLMQVESSAGDIREAVAGLAAEQRWPVLQMTAESVSLEEVFRQLTQESAAVGVRKAEGETLR